MEKLVKLIQDEIQKRKDNQNLFSDEKEFFSDFLLDDITNIYNINIAKFLTAILITNGINMTFSDVLSKSNKLVSIFEDNDDLDLIYTYFTIAQEFREIGLLKILYDFENTDDIVKYKSELDAKFEKFKQHDLDEKAKYFIKIGSSIFCDYDDAYDDALRLNNYIEQSKNFFELFISCKNNEAFISTLDFIVCFRFLKSEKFNLLLEFVRKDDKQKMIIAVLKRFAFKNGYNTLGDLDKINKYYNMLIDKINRKNREDRKKIKYCNQLLSILKQSSTKPILLNEKLFKLCVTEQIQSELLIFINKFNLKFYQKTAIINHNYHNSPFNKLELLFTKNNFNFKKLSLEAQERLINDSDIDKVSEIISFLSTNDFGFINENNKMFIEILLYSSSNILANIESFINSNILTNKFIQNYPTILISERSNDCEKIKKLFTYEKFIQKILLLSDNNIDIKQLIVNEPKVFEKTLSFLKMQLDITNCYKISLDGKNKSFEILKDYKLLDLVDNFIELGLNEYIENNLQVIVSDNYNLINRIILANKLGIEIFDDSNNIKNKILNKSKFYISDDRLKEITINYSINHINPKYELILKNNKRNFISNQARELLSILFCYEKNDLIYEFNNTIISKNRVLRNLEVILNCDELKDETSIEILFQAILYGSFIFDGEYEIKYIYDTLEKNIEMNNFQISKENTLIKVKH